MKKLMTLALAAGMLLGAASGAHAIDFKAQGMWLMGVGAGDGSFVSHTRQAGATSNKSVFGNFSFYSYKKACGQKKTVRGSKNSRRLSNGTPAI